MRTRSKIICISLIILSSCSKNEEAIEHFNKGKQAYSKQVLDSAIEEFETSVNLDSDLLPARIMLGKSHYFKGNFEDAEKIFLDTSKKFPGNALCLHWLGKIKITNLESFDEAKGFFLQSVQLDDSNFNNNYYLAKIYEKEGKLKEALIEYNKALLIKNDFNKVHTDLSNLYSKMGEQNRAEQELNKVSSR
jgi:tetratricopeptide (TPR) repeat protein